MPSSDADTLQLRVLSLNVWGLKYVSKYRKERIRAIAEYICKEASTSKLPDDRPAGPPAAGANGHRDSNDVHRSASRPGQRANAVVGGGDSTTTPQLSNGSGTEASRRGSRWDVVCLQELWCSEDWEYLQARCQESGSGLVHGRYFYSGALGSGCCILSKHPIVATSTWPYSLNGNPLHVIEGDFFVAKSCGQATLDLGKAHGLCTVLNTHFFAPGGEWGDEWKRAHRLAQAWELARLANIAAERGQHVIVCGDLNSGPTTLTINMLLSHSRLSDSWAFTHPPELTAARSRSRSPNVEISAHEAVASNGITCDNPLNTWSAAKTFDEQVTRQKGKRLDYILFRNSKSASSLGWQGSESKNSRFRPIDTRVVAHEEKCEVFDRKTKGKGQVSLSDHFGIETLFEFTTTVHTDASVEEVPLVPDRPAPREVLPLAMAAISMYSTWSASSTRRQLGLFALSLLGIPVLSVAASFQPLKWLNWIFVLLGVANGVGGATMLYTGFVGGRWERSALKNVLQDMSIEVDRIERAERAS